MTDSYFSDERLLLNDQTVERVARAVHAYEGGADDRELVHLTGKPRRAWETSAPWDQQPDVELCEWERDDYRAQARAAIRAFFGLETP